MREDTPAGTLHAALQIAMGWTNSHLHEFLVGERRYADPFQEEDNEFGTPYRSEWEYRLVDMVRKPGAEFVYRYDYGDDWRHRILVAAVEQVDPFPDVFAICLDGRRARPPEDCHDYNEFRAILADPKHPEHAETLRWVGGKFDPEAFDVQETNTYLWKLPWPLVSERQLRAVLRERAGEEWPASWPEEWK